MIPYAIGFDIGITSVGWAVVLWTVRTSRMALSTWVPAFSMPPSSPRQELPWQHRGERPEAHAAGCAVTSIGWSVFAASF